MTAIHGKKLLVSLVTEGKFSGEELQALDEGADMLTARARELVTERGISYQSEAACCKVEAEQGKLLSPPPVTPGVAPKHRGCVANRSTNASA